MGNLGKRNEALHGKLLQRFQLERNSPYHSLIQSMSCMKMVELQTCDNRLKTVSMDRFI